MTVPIPLERIQKKIYSIRNQQVILGPDLAALYDVEPRALNQAVKRNIERFPRDFMFRLSDAEFTDLKSQIVISSWGGSRAKPYAFTEQGVAMLSSILRSKRAVCVNIEIMRAFVNLRGLTASHRDLAMKIEELEKKFDRQFKIVFDALRKLISPPEKPQKRIGFHSDKE